MLTIRPKNWVTFQHYKKRTPPWIKLHRTILDDYDFHCLPVASKALAPLMWLLASESETGEIECDMERLGFRFRMKEAEVEKAIKPLIDKGFFVACNGDSTMLAQCKQGATVETETETERERERESDKKGKKTTVNKSQNITVKNLVDDYGVDEQVANDWVTVRKNAGAKSLTKTAMTEIVNQAGKAGLSVRDAIQFSAQAEWRGFKAEWYNNRTGGNHGKANSGGSGASRSKRDEVIEAILEPLSQSRI